MKEWIVPDEDIGIDGGYYGYKQLIRCKECEMWDGSYEVEGYGKRCMNTMVVTKPDFYCGWGQRNE